MGDQNPPGGKGKGLVEVVVTAAAVDAAEGSGEVLVGDVAS